MASCLDQTKLMPTAAWGRTALCASLPMLKDTSYYITKGSSHSCVMGSCFLRCELMGTQVCNQKVVAITFLPTAGEKKKSTFAFPLIPLMKYSFCTSLLWGCQLRLVVLNLPASWYCFSY